MRVVAYVDDDLDDLRQVYRVKAWRALAAYDPAKCRPKRGETAQEALDRFVFMCLKNAEKDVLKRRRRNEVPLNLRLESHPRVEHEEMFHVVEDEAPSLPNTLNGLEIRVVVLLYRGYAQAEAARRLGIDSRHMKEMMKTIRQKMADWRPTVTADGRAAVAV